MPDDYSLEPVSTSGTKWAVTVDRKGWFKAVSPWGKTVHGRSYRELEEACRVETSRSKIRVEVPYIRWDSYSRQLVEGVATGRHGSTGKILVRENGKAGQLEAFLVRVMQPGMPEGVRSTYSLCMRDIVRAGEQIAGIEREYSMPDALARVVDDAVEAARQAEERGTDDSG
jgi:hypothetical protein